MAHSYHNIETKPFDGLCGFRVGYAKSGAVRVFGDSRNGYRVVYGNSQANAENGLVGQYLFSAGTLAEVSARLETT